MKHEWKDVLDNNGVLLTSGTERLLVSLENESSKVLHVLDIPTARALHEALGRALEEIDTRPITDSTSATANPVQEIVCVHPSGAGDHGSTDVTTGDGMTRYAVQQVPRSLRSISTEELAKLGLKPKAHLPSDGYLLECGHWSIHKQWCTECAADIVAISQMASQPEPPPTGNGEIEPLSS